MLNNIFYFFGFLCACFLWISIFIISTPILYFYPKFYKYIPFSHISIHIRILFLIFYILIYIFSSKKYKKYLIIFFIVLYLYFTFFISTSYFAIWGM